MQFPQDHYPHTKTEVEWWYVWGNLDNGNYFHWALFKKGDKLAVHGSIHDSTSIYFEEFPVKINDAICFDDRGFKIWASWFEFECMMIGLPQIHKHERNYYSVPYVAMFGRLCSHGLWEKVSGEGWFDHEWGEKPKHNWDWVSTKFNNGNAGVFYGKTGDFQKKFPFQIKSIMQEKIFHPAFGWPYSEQPIAIFDDEQQIGHGMRERTYRRF